MHQGKPESRSDSVRRAPLLDLEARTFREVVTWLRLGGWDPDIFLRCVPVVYQEFWGLTGQQREELSGCLDRLEEETARKADLAFEIGRLRHLLGDFEKARVSYLVSLEGHGERVTTCYNLGLCCRQLGEREQARYWADRSLRLDPTYTPARRLLGLVSP